MDRDRDRDREREWGRGYTERIGGGQSYRPGERPRRSRSPSASYSNDGSFRPSLPRSRSPHSFDGRPPRRFDSPARINPGASTYRPGPTPRSPADSRGDDARWRRSHSRSRSRSPRRRWSPRRRSRSREGHGVRSGPTPDRPHSPPRSYGARPRSPDRGQFASDWRGPRSPSNRSRLRSPSPNSRGPPPGASPGINSGNSSRRSSPPLHPSRMHLQAKLDQQSPTFPSGPAMRSPLPHAVDNRVPPNGRYMSRETTSHSDSTTPYQPTGRGKGQWGHQEPPTGPRQPSSEISPSLQGPRSVLSAPTGPAASSVVKRNSINVLSAPTQPRGAPPSGPSAAYVKRPIPHPAPIQTQQSSNLSTSTSPSPRTSNLPSTSPSLPSGQIPTGPRAAQSSWGWRGNSQTPGPTHSTRNARFGSPIIPGGKLLPSLVPLAVQDRLKKLELERELVERELKEKLEVKRKTMWEWQRLESEVTNARYRSELAEQQLTEIGF